MPLNAAVLGDGYVGKTCLIITYKTGVFPHDNTAGLFDEYYTDVIVEDKLCSLYLWDTPGQDDYDRSILYPGTHVLLLCHALNEHSSYDNIVTKWYPELERYCPGVPIILVGTKLDLRDSDKEQAESVFDAKGPVLMEEGLQMKGKNDNVVKYMECSALTGQGVNEVFEEAARIALTHKLSKRSDTRKY